VADESVQKSESKSEKKLLRANQKGNLLAITNGDSTREEESQGNEVGSLLVFARDMVSSKTTAHEVKRDCTNPVRNSFIQESDEESFVLGDGSVSIDLPRIEDANGRNEAPGISREPNEHMPLLAAFKRSCSPNADDLPSFVDCNTNMFPRPGATSPLHEACGEEFPNRLSEPGTDILSVADELILDIVHRSEKLDFITKYLPHNCMMENRDGDLPVHLLVRRLVEWEAAWQEQLTFAKVEKWTDVTKFTQIRKCMGECVDKVLNPMVRNRLACRSRGKLGTRILPLHAAAMFAVPYETIQLLLESYPEAASVTCYLGDLHTYIADKSLPLERTSGTKTERGVVCRFSAESRENCPRQKLMTSSEEIRKKLSMVNCSRNKLWIRQRVSL